MVAELGTGHDGDRTSALRLIDAAEEAGADCIKVQVVFADEILHPLAGRVSLPGGDIPLYTRFKELERPPEFYREIKDHAESLGIGFLATPFGPASAAIVRDLGVRAVKIASPELGHLPLLREVASYRVPVILSTGVSTLADIERAVGITGDRSVLLHCVTRYPAREEEYNLNVLPPLATLFGAPVGVSDHSLDPVLVPTAAVALGACLVEKHFTLAREGLGLDDPIALVPQDFARMVASVREAEDRPAEKTLERLSSEYGAERVRQVLGTGRKELAPGEREFYESTNRSIHALARIEAGETIDESRIALLRSEKNLRPGLHAEHWPVVVGRKARRAVPEGAGITWEDIL